MTADRHTRRRNTWLALAAGVVALVVTGVLGAFAVAELSGLSGAGPFAHSMLNVLGSYNEADPLLVRPREAAVLTAGDREARGDDAAHEH